MRSRLIGNDELIQLVEFYRTRREPSVGAGVEYITRRRRVEILAPFLQHAADQFIEFAVLPGLATRTRKHHVHEEGRNREGIAFGRIVVVGRRCLHNVIKRSEQFVNRVNRAVLLWNLLDHLGDVHSQDTVHSNVIRERRNRRAIGAR